jgi:hypothetical protein
MIQCSRCETWGHAFCFGYISANDSRIPADHFCYRCINDGTNSDAFNLDEAANVAITRRGLCIVWDEGITNVTAFAKRLGKFGLPFRPIRALKELVK